MKRTTSIALVAALATATPLCAQPGLRAGQGAFLGLAASIPTTVAYATIRAELGDPVYNVPEAVRELAWIPILLVGAGSTIAMARDEEFAMGRASLGVFGGALAGGLLGRGLAQVITDDDPGRWTGLTIGLAVGALAGGAVGFLSRASGDPLGTGSTAESGTLGFSVTWSLR